MSVASLYRCAIAALGLCAAMPLPSAADELRASIVFEAPQHEEYVAKTDVPTLETALADFAKSFGSGAFKNYFTACARVKKTVCTSSDLAVVTVMGQPSKQTPHTYPVHMISYALSSARPSTSFDTTIDLVDAKGAANTAAFDALSDSDLQGLLGTPVLVNGRIVFESYSPFLQLVPKTATDAKYVGLLQYYLGQQRIQTVASHYVGVSDDTGAPAGTSAATTVCQNSPRYMVFGVAMAQNPEPWNAKTVLDVKASGNILDCVQANNRLTFGDAFSFPVTTSKAPLSSVINILSLLFIVHQNNWTSVGNAAASVANFIDVAPDGPTVEQQVYDRALRELVANMCLATAPTPTPSPTATPTPTPTAPPPGMYIENVAANVSGGGTGGGSTPAQPASPASVTLAANQLTSAAPESLVCAPAKP